jgi:aspartate racemase
MMAVSRIGIIGGVGPLAAAHFYQRLIQLTDVDRDEDHLPVVLVSDRIPSRVAHLAGAGADPTEQLRRAVRTLVEVGVDLIVIPSTTTHAYHRVISAGLPVPVLNMLAEVAAAIARSGFRRPVFLATAASATLRLFDPYLPPSVVPAYPVASGQDEVDQLIDGVKRGDPLPALQGRLTRLMQAEPWPHRADCVVLACTELPVIAPGGDTRLPILSVTDELALAALARCGVKAKSPRSAAVGRSRVDVGAATAPRKA